MNSQNQYLTEYAGDVVTYLIDQHDELKVLMGRVLSAHGEPRQQAFDAVREVLARHEAAEEAVVRPLTREAPGGEDQAAARDGEEDRAEHALGALEHLDVDSIAFETQFRELQDAVLRHAGMEETQEFPLLRRSYGPEALRAARAAVERAEAGERPAPARHGTFATMLERARRLFA